MPIPRRTRDCATSVMDEASALAHDAAEPARGSPTRAAFDSCAAFY
jgi:hypothetical protein